MAKKVLIISASPRTGGNSDLLCDQFKKGAEETGNTVEKVQLQKQKIGGCLACYGCRGTGACVQKDDMEELYFIATAAAGRRAMERTMDAMQGFADCLPGARVMGRIYGEGVYQKGEAEATAAFEQAYEVGRSL